MSSITARQSRRLSNQLKTLPGRIFVVDLRSLAVFRAATALLLLLDLIRHLPWLNAFYSDVGVLPRGWQPSAHMLWRISLHAANGQTLFEGMLLALALLAAAALFVGWRTRLAAIVSFVLYASLLNRAAVVVGGGEQLLALLLFWGCFLPLNARWSVDAALSVEEGADRITAHFSWASAALLLQITIALIWVTALAQHADPLTAIITQRTYTAPAGLWLQNHPSLLHWAAWIVTVIGLAGPVLLFAPPSRWRLRPLALIALTLLQLGAALCFDLGLAPWVALAALTPFLGPDLWERLRARTAREVPLRLFHDLDRPRSRRLHLLLREFLILPAAQLHAAQSQPRTATLLRANDSWIVIDRDDHAYLRWAAWVLLLRRSPLFGPLGRLLAKLPLHGVGDAAYRLIRRFGSGAPSTAKILSLSTGAVAQRFAAICLALILLWNLSLAGLLPQALQTVLSPPLRLLRLDQPWNRYLPAGADGNGWFVIPGSLANGQQINLLQPDQPLDFKLPAVLARHQGDSAWHRYRDVLWQRSGDDSDRARYAGYLCRRWNDHAAPERRLQSLKIVYLLEGPPQAGEDSIEQHVLWRQNCYAVPKPAGADG